MVAAIQQAADVKYKRTFAGLKRGLKKAAELLLEKSREIVPIDTGALHDSSKVTLHGRGYATAESRVSYRMFYAIYVHEDLSAQHAPGKTAKFLEGPSRRYRREMAAIVKKESQVK